jgi:hypothetical protein
MAEHAAAAGQVDRHEDLDVGGDGLDDVDRGGCAVEVAIGRKRLTDVRAQFVDDGGCRNGITVPNAGSCDAPRLCFSEGAMGLAGWAVIAARGARPPARPIARILGWIAAEGVAGGGRRPPQGDVSEVLCDH